MQSNKIRIISYVTPELREQLSEVAEEEATSESGIVTRALLMLFRERDRWNQHIQSEKMMQQAREIRDGQSYQGYGSGTATASQGSQTAISEG